MTDASKGQSFKDVLQGPTSRPRERAIGLLRGAAEALDSFHARTGVHGSIRPDALVAAADGQIRLLPPGQVSVPLDDPVAGAYLSPQRHAGEPPRAPDDLFALGVVA